MHLKAANTTMLLYMGGLCLLSLFKWLLKAQKIHLESEDRARKAISLPQSSPDKYKYLQPMLLFYFPPLCFGLNEILYH